MEHYLDNAATTAVLPRAREAALSAMDQFGNPGSLHAMGQRARTLLEDSRGRVAAALGVKPGCVTFKSRADERYLRISIQNIGGTAGFSYFVSVN